MDKLSEEEKKAIESLIEIREFANLSNYKDTKISQLNAIDVVLKLIEKQSKEIEELKKPKYLLNAKTGEITTINNSEFISKDKIKAKIEEIENEDKKYKNYLKDGRENFTPEYVWARPVLQSLLEKE